MNRLEVTVTNRGELPISIASFPVFITPLENEPTHADLSRADIDLNGLPLSRQELRGRRRSEVWFPLSHLILRNGVQI
jgi:hypothetical protein